MSDTSEYWHDVREWARERREHHREKTLKKSLEALRKAGIKYETHNDGYHLIIRTSRGAVNFYPTTGRYNGTIAGYDVEDLVKDLKNLELEVKECQTRNSEH